MDEPELDADTARLLEAARQQLASARIQPGKAYARTSPFDIIVPPLDVARASATAAAQAVPPAEES